MSSARALTRMSTERAHLRRSMISREQRIQQITQRMNDYGPRTYLIYKTVLHSEEAYLDRQEVELLALNTRIDELLEEVYAPC